MALVVGHPIPTINHLTRRTGFVDRQNRNTTHSTCFNTCQTIRCTPTNTSITGSNSICSEWRVRLQFSIIGFIATTYSSDVFEFTNAHWKGLLPLDTYHSLRLSLMTHGSNKLHLSAARKYTFLDFHLEKTPKIYSSQRISRDKESRIPFPIFECNELAREGFPTVYGL